MRWIPGKELIGSAVRPPASSEVVNCPAKCGDTIHFRTDAIGRLVEYCPTCDAAAERAARLARRSA